MRAWVLGRSLLAAQGLERLADAVVRVRCAVGHELHAHALGAQLHDCRRLVAARAELIRHVREGRRLLVERLAPGTGHRLEPAAGLGFTDRSPRRAADAGFGRAGERVDAEHRSLRVAVVDRVHAAAPLAGAGLTGGIDVLSPWPRTSLFGFVAWRARAGLRGRRRPAAPS